MGRLSERLFGWDYVKAFASATLFMTGNQAIMVLLPLYMAQLGFSPSQLGVATSLTSFMAMCARPVTGRVADTLGRRAALVTGAAIMALGTAGFPALPFVAAITMIRFAQGYGFSSASTAHIAIATDVLPPGRMRSGLAVFGVSTTIANAVGASVAMAMLAGGGFTAAWLGGAAFFLASGLIGLTFTYEKFSVPKRRARAAGGSAIPAGARVWQMFEKSALPAALVQMVLYAAISCCTFMPVYAAEIGVSEIGLYYTLYAVAMFLSNLAVSGLYDRVRSFLWLMLPGTLCVAIGYAVMALAHGAPLFLLSGVFSGVGFGVTGAAISVKIMSAASPERRGAASATYQCGGDLGYCVGALALGFLAGPLGYRALYVIAALLPLAAAGLSIAFFRGRKCG